MNLIFLCKVNLHHISIKTDCFENVTCVFVVLTRQQRIFL